MQHTAAGLRGLLDRLEVKQIDLARATGATAPMVSRWGARTWYRVRLTADSYIGFGPATVYTHGMPSLVPVLEPEAQCFDSPRVAAEVAIQAGILPFTVERAE